MAGLKHRLRPVELDFVGSAPLRLAFSAAVAASPEAVHRALAEDTEGWSEWFAAVSSARRTPQGRQVTLAGGLRFEETVLASEAPKRYAYRADAMNRPGARAIVEEWRIEPAARGSLVQWTVAVDPARPAALLLRLATPVMRAAFRRAVHRLDLRLATRD